MSGSVQTTKRRATLFGSSAVVGSFVASGGYTVRRRGGQRGPVAVRPRLSPGVPLSRDGASYLGSGPGPVKQTPRVPFLKTFGGVSLKPALA